MPMNATTSTTTTCEDAASTPALLRSTEERKFLRRMLCDVLIFIIVIIPVIVCEFGIEPFRRGFFCDDESIAYPFRNNTVTPVELGLLIGLFPILLIVLVEFIGSYQRGRLSDTIRCFCWQRTPAWLVACAKHMAYFSFGLALTFDVTEVGKYTIGRLRPHFLAVCQPALGDGSTCSDAHNQHRYIENYICIASGYSAVDVRQARLSFPSGHSSLAFYAMVYLALYLQRSLTWRGSKLSRHFLQFLLITMAWYTALSRIMDNWHHWSDVLIGSLLGIIGAILTARYISKLFVVRHSHLSGLSLHIPRQDTETTLEDAISTTPPPYTTVNSFCNEQYCTKV